MSHDWDLLDTPLYTADPKKQGSYEYEDILAENEEPPDIDILTYEEDNFNDGSQVCSDDELVSFRILKEYINLSGGERNLSTVDHNQSSFEQFAIPQERNCSVWEPPIEIAPTPDASKLLQFFGEEPHCCDHADCDSAAIAQDVQLEVVNASPVLLPGVTYVNPKQYHRIMKRREARKKMIEEGKLPTKRKPYLHKSRHINANRRIRKENGSFANGALTCSRDS